MANNKIYILLFLLFIASWFYTSSDKLAIYGFGIMGLLTIAFTILIVLNNNTIEQGFKTSSLYLLLPSWFTRLYVFIMVLLFAISIKLVIQVVLQLGRRADTLGSTDLNLSKESMRILWRFRDTYYVYLIGLSMLLLSFVYSGNLIGIKGLKWIQVMLMLALFVVFFVFADLFVKGEFAKIKNESTKPTKTLVLDTENAKDKQERIGDTSVVRI